MLFFGYSPFPPYLTYHVADRTGALVRSEPIDIAWPSMIHDFAVTIGPCRVHPCPLVFSFENVKQRGGVFSWEPERGTRLGVMPRSGGSADVRWFETEPSLRLPPLNAYDEAGKVVVDVARYDRLDFMAPESARDPDWQGDRSARMHRWTIDLAGGGVRSVPLDDLSCEFPRADERRLGRKHRYGYVAVQPRPTGRNLPAWSGIRRYDLERSTFETHDFGPASGAGEPLFVPRSGAAAEDDGYLIVLVYDGERNASDFHVLDARNVAGEPIATVRLPHRVPYGFHGNWVPA
jgi:carotenoid cleavage dioxygenase